LTNCILNIQRTNIAGCPHKNNSQQRSELMIKSVAREHCKLKFPQYDESR